MMTEIDKITGKSILFTHDQQWKDMRNLFHELAECVFDFVKFYEEKAVKNDGRAELETHEAMARVTADGIARTALGFKGNSTRIENCDKSFASSFRGLLMQVVPKLFKFLGLQIFSTKVQKWFEKIVLHEILRRQKLKIHKSDVIHQLMMAKEEKLTDGKLKWTDDDLVAQGVTMFLGGFGTTTNLMDALFFEQIQTKNSANFDGRNR